MPGSIRVGLHPDFLALIGCFARARCRYIVVGGQALAANGRPRFTQDLDVLVEPGPRNAARVAAAIADFGFPKLAEAIRDEFSHPKRMATLGVAPVAIDIMTTISGVSFETAWAGRVVVKLGQLRVPFLGVRELLLNKVASGRDKDLIDAANLRELISARKKRRKS